MRCDVRRGTFGIAELELIHKNFSADYLKPFLT
jgi:hypothetical protein